MNSPSSRPAVIDPRRSGVPLRGYRIFREPYAKRIDTDADDLDERVAEIVRTWLEARARPPSASQRDDGS
jgi:hypothetical protein